jgi:antitoxin CcdA
MKQAHPKPRSPVRRATNVTLRADLVEEAKRLEINLSRELEARLEVLVRQARGAQWRKDNHQAIAAYGRYFEKHGIWDEDSRGW